MTPKRLYLEAGGRYTVDRVRCDGVHPSYASGGYGVRYTVRTYCEHEANYNKVFYLYYEGYGKLGRWRCGDDYIAADVFWGGDGSIIPTAIYFDEFRYDIGKRGVLQMYPMSSRKTDGSGMRYIVKGTCKELRDCMWK